jgi:hypothetical protein
VSVREGAGVGERGCGCGCAYPEIVVRVAGR